MELNFAHCQIQQRCIDIIWVNASNGIRDKYITKYYVNSRRVKCLINTVEPVYLTDIICIPFIHSCFRFESTERSKNSP